MKLDELVARIISEMPHTENNLNLLCCEVWHRQNKILKTRLVTFRFFTKELNSNRLYSISDIIETLNEMK